MNLFLCDITTGEIQTNICFAYINRELITDQSNDITRVQLGELMSLLGEFTGAWVKGYLLENGMSERY